MSNIKRGTFLLASAWGVQLICGYGIASWLSTQLDVVAYGTYGVIMSVLIWIEVGAISGLPTAVQKYTASHRSDVRHILKIVNAAQIIFVAVLFILAQILAPWISRQLGDASYVSYLRLASWDIWVYSFFFIYMSVQNGFKNFGRHALLITIYSITKLTGVVVLVSLWPSVDSALIANIAGSVCALIVALIFWKKLPLPTPGKPVIQWKEIINFAWPVVIFSLLIQIFPNIDLWMTKAFCSAESPGYYTAASNLARIPFYLFFGLAATVLPAISEALSKRDYKGAQSTITMAIRLLVICVAPICAIVWPWADEVVFLLFRQEFAPAGAVLKILIIGHSGLAFLFLMTTILNAANKPRMAFLLTALIVILDIGLLRWLTPAYGMTGAALATTLALLAGVFCTGIPVWREFKPNIPILFWVRIVLASLFIGVLAGLIHLHGLLLIAAGAGLMIIYFLILWCMGEIRPSEIFN
ncbi:oligosaccharide flippase family protein [bacterium]|nr:oligosaccharide flippase family protein [bacterium]